MGYCQTFSRVRGHYLPLFEKKSAAHYTQAGCLDGFLCLHLRIFLTFFSVRLDTVNLQKLLH